MLVQHPMHKQGPLQGVQLLHIALALLLQGNLQQLQLFSQTLFLILLVQYEPAQKKKQNTKQ